MAGERKYHILVSVLLGIILAWGCSSKQDTVLSTEKVSISYPDNKSDPEKYYELWGERIADPYAWLSETEDQKVLDWSQQQNRVTFDYISKIPQRAKLLDELEALLPEKEYGKAKRSGDYYFYTVTAGARNNEVVYYSSFNNDDERIFVDPRKFSGNVNAHFASLSVSPDNKYAAFSLQDPHTRNEKIFVKNLLTDRFLPDVITASYNTTIAWDNQGGFFYNKGFVPEYNKDSVGYAVFYHIPGEKTGRDVPVFFGSPSMKAGNDIWLTSDNRYVIIRSVKAKGESEVRYVDLQTPPPHRFRLLSAQVGAGAFIIDNWDNHFLVLTYKNAPNGRVVLIDPEHPAENQWKTLIPETQDIMQRVFSVDGKFYVRSLFQMAGRISAYDSSGYRTHLVDLPGNGVVEGFSAFPGYSDALYTYQSFNHPPTVFKYSFNTNRSEVYRKSTSKVNPADYEVRKEFCLTPEGVGIPLLIFYKSGLRKDGTAPLLFSFSGGMGETYRPSYSLGNIPFVEHGGIFVLAGVRGAQEMGQAWFEAGLKDKRARMESDVKMCLQYLIKEKYTSRGNIALVTKYLGASAATEVVLKNPGLVKMLGIFHGVFDLTGYPNYAGCKSCIAEEFGNPERAKEYFTELKKISPLLRSYQKYTWPAVYLEHSLTDKKVLPVHSFKFMASLQDGSTADMPPKLIRIDNECCVQNRQQELFVLSDRWALAMHIMGMKY